MHVEQLKGPMGFVGGEALVDKCMRIPKKARRHGMQSDPSKDKILHHLRDPGMIPL